MVNAEGSRKALMRGPVPSPDGKEEEWHHSIMQN